MSTDRQAKANRANAQRSTGPSSAVGKRKVAQNARRHGLTTPPPWDQVTRWYRIITGDLQAQPDLTSLDRREQAAIRLAVTEAQVERATTAERNHLVDLQERLGRVDTDQSHTERAIERIKERGLDLDDYDTLILLAEKLEDRSLTADIRFLARTSPTRPTALRQTLKTLTRYRRDAESARRSALKVWLEVNG